MVEYTPDDTLEILRMFKALGKSRKKKDPEKVKKMIKYVEQRRKFFNPPDEILDYIIKIGRENDLDSEIMSKLESDQAGRKRPY